ncbi:hypothetical protein ACWCQW_53425 [Streptomyces mirabilis]
MAFVAPWVAVVLVESTVYRSLAHGLQQLATIAVGTVVATGVALMLDSTMVTSLFGGGVAGDEGVNADDSQDALDGFPHAHQAQPALSVLGGSVGGYEHVPLEDHERHTAEVGHGPRRWNFLDCARCPSSVGRPATDRGRGPLLRALRQQLRAHVTAAQQTHRSGLKGFDGGTRLSAEPMGAAPRRKEILVYIGLGTVVVIIVIVAVVMMLRRR